MLTTKFHINPQSPYYKDEPGSGKKLILYGRSDARSIRAAQRAQEMEVEHARRACGRCSMAEKKEEVLRRVGSKLSHLFLDAPKNR